MAQLKRYNSLDDFLVSTALTADSPIMFGPNLTYPVKGREIEATVLFSDISGYSARTLDLNPIETLAFVNQFFSWMTGMAIENSHGIIDKYIGDEIMIVFSREFGSEDPFTEAVKVARLMGEKDFFGFVPHSGIASGRVVVGYAGTSFMYNCSVFGGPVALAARCASNKPKLSEDANDLYSCSITFPESEWNGHSFDTHFPPKKYQFEDRDFEHPTSWEILPSRTMRPKNMDEIEIREIVDRAIYVPDSSPEETAKRLVSEMRANNRYWPTNGS